MLFFFQQKKISNQEVVIYFVGIRKITRLHAKYFNDPTPTDCITFPLTSPPTFPRGDQLLGEIFICPKAALDYNPKKPYEETTLYILHGLLHLLGYDDIESKKRVRMRREEKRLMALAKKRRCMVIPKEHEKAAFEAARKSPGFNDRKARCIKVIQLALRSLNRGFLARFKSRFFMFLGYKENP